MVEGGWNGIFILFLAELEFNIFQFQSGYLYFIMWKFVPTFIFAHLHDKKGTTIECIWFILIHKNYGLNLFFHIRTTREKT